MSQKKKVKKLRKSSEFESPDNASPDYMRSWLENVKKSKNFYEHDEDLKEINSDEDSDEFECNLKELEKPLKKLLKKRPDSELRKLVSTECEWLGCQYETTDERNYDHHVHDHLINLENLKCQWDLCKFETEDRTDFLRHLDFHAYHTRLKTFGLGLLRIITVPNCQTDSKFRNVIPDIDQDYFCYWNGCSQSFPIYKIYLEHVSDHIEKLKPDLFSELKYRKKITELKVKCQWDDCQTESSNVFTLKRHVKSHTNEKMIGCANCGVLFATKTFFINHCVRQDVTQRNFQCPDCFRLYPTEKLLKEHTRGHVNKYQCQFCGLSWQKQSVLARHIRYRHLTEQPFGCDECEYKAKTKRDLESHQKVHKTGDLFKCEEFQCEYTSRTLQALKRHDAKVHLDRPPSYQCHCCDKVFEKGCLLSKHLIRDHGFQLAPGHSRFIYKQDFDGFYRLQTKRVENLKEIPQTVTAPPDDDAKIKTYEIENISISENLSTPINIKLKEIVRPTKMDTPTYSIFGDDSTQDSKDINDFAIVKNYKKIIKKRKLDATEN